MAVVLTGAVAVWATVQAPQVPAVDEKALSEFTGTYEWARDSFVDLQMWDELAGTRQLVAVDETERSARSTRTARIASLPALAQPSRHPSNRASSFNAMRPVRSPA